MPKEYSIRVGRDEKPLRYTMDDRRALESKFGCSLYELLMKRAGTESAGGVWTALGGQWDVQVDMLFQGLKHLGPTVTRAKVEGWMKAAIKDEPGGVLPYLVAMTGAIMSSGVLGMRYVLPDTDESESDDLGKAEDAQAPASGESS